MRSLALTWLCLAAAAPTSAQCLRNGTPDTCQYPPLRDDFGSVVKITGLNEEQPASFAGSPENLHRVTLTGNNSRCADGSPAVMYVRNATTVAAEDRWVIVLEGGGSGFDPNSSLDQGMWDRWTGGGSTPLLNWLQKSSTDWRVAGAAVGRDGIPDLPLEVVVGGILDGTNSSFSDWNAVFVNYCSSDGWMGQKSNVEMPGAGSWVDGDDVWAGFKMDFHGHDIVADVLDMLDDPTWGADGNPEYRVNDIEDGEIVLFVGESAGGGGVMHNLDFVADTLTAFNPNIVVLGSIGASHNATIATPADTWWRDDDGNGVDDIGDGAISRWAQASRIDAFVDMSCAGAGNAWECMLLPSTLPFLMTPVHIKQDMSDPLVSRPYPSVATYQDGIVTDYSNWLAIGDPPFFAPDCGRHASLTGPKYHDHVLQQRELLAGGGIGATVVDEISYDEALFRFAHPGLPPELVHDNLTGMTGGGTEYIWVTDCP